MSEHFDSHMNQSDATMWRIERDPSLRTTIVGIAILSEAPAWERLRARIEEITWEIPRLRQKVMPPPFGIGTPRWVEDEGFDLDYHLRRVKAPAPGDLHTVLDLAGPIAMTAFDRARPLWEFTLVEGLADGRAAMIQKIHHCLTDGVGAIRMARIAFDEQQHHAHVPHRPLTGGEHRPSGLRVAVDTLAGQAVATAHLMGRTATAMPDAMNEMMFHPERMAKTVVGTAQSIVKMVRPARDPLSPVMRERGMSRRLAAIDDLSLAELKDAGHASGGTMNDAFLAAIAGGMRRYHQRHGVDVARLRVTMPINLRTQGDSIGNNRFTPARFALPIDVADPTERMQQLGEMARSWRREPGLKFTDVVAGALNLMPEAMTTAVVGSMLKAIDFVATNVPGMNHPAHLAGATVEQQFAFAPPSGSAFSAALLSHLDRCTLGIVIDHAAVLDPEVLVECIAEGFEEVLEVGRAAQRQPAKAKKAKKARAAPAGRSKASR